MLATDLYAVESQFQIPPKLYSLLFFDSEYENQYQSCLY